MTAAKTIVITLPRHLKPASPQLVPTGGSVSPVLAGDFLRVVKDEPDDIRAGDTKPPRKRQRLDHLSQEEKIMRRTQMDPVDGPGVKDSCNSQTKPKTVLKAESRMKTRMTPTTTSISSVSPSVTAVSLTASQEKSCSSADKSTTKTRQSSAIFGLGHAITTKDSVITGARLPTSRQVLRCLMFHLQEGASENITKWQSAKIVLSKIIPFYQKGSIPMISERKACERMIQLLQDNAKVRAIPCNRRSTAASLQKVKQMEDQLDKTFPLWPANADQLIKNPEDIRFLQSMKSDRAATFGCCDMVLAGKNQRRIERKKTEASRRLKFEQMSCKTTVTDVSDIFSSGDDTDKADATESDADCPASSSNEIPATISKSHHRTVYTGTTVSIPPDIIQRPKLVAVAARLKLSPTQQAVYTQALIEESGGDLSKLYSSYSTADKARRTVGCKIAQTCKEQWVAPKFATLHWDSKLMPSLCNKNVTEERLTVVVGTVHELKLLGVPSYQPGTDRKSLKAIDIY